MYHEYSGQRVERLCPVSEFKAADYLLLQNEMLAKASPPEAI